MVISQATEKLKATIRAGAHWSVVVRPTRFKADRIPSLERCWNVMEQCAVSLRGWDYPHIDRENRGYASDSIYSWCDFAGKQEYWRLFQSGQMVHVFALKEGRNPEFFEKRLWTNLDDVPSQAQPTGPVDVFEILYKATEVLEFSSRLAQRLALDSPLVLEIDLVGISGRILTMPSNRSFDKYYGSSEPKLEYRREIPLDELIASSADLAIQSSVWFFERFGWTNPPIDELRRDQQKLLMRTF